MFHAESLILGLISAGCIFCGFLLGLLLRRVVPDNHLQEESKDTIKLGAGMVATVSALVLGLLVASAKTAFDTTQEEITQRAAKIVFLDHLLSDYGPETQPAREQLRKTVAATIQILWPKKKNGTSGLTEYERLFGMRTTQLMLFNLTPTTEAQRRLYDSAQRLLTELRQSRWALIQREQRTVPLPFLVVLLFWLTMLHISFGLFAPRNATVLTVLFVSAFSVSAAIFIILDMSHPLQGVITVSGAPMQKALELLGQ
jgi:hypothetical protein